jgi:uncharacterized surface protein with fasciclin (FAS1) repeats
MSMNDLMSVIINNGELSVLDEAIHAADLQDTLHNDGPFTIFAPTNAAFAKVPSKTMEELARDPKRLQAVLNYHVLPGKVLASDVKPGNAKTLHGANVALGSTAGYVNVEGALVTKADLTATNGVVHVIDAVLLPPSR